MREHLYRGFHPDKNGTTEITLNGEKIKGEWVKGSYVYAHKFYGTGEAAHFIYNIYGEQRVAVLPETVGEYTGLLDKNDKKIFEGDILRATYDGDAERIYEVIFYNGGYKMRTKDCETMYDYSIHDDHPEFEVIGNIYDNPELLEGKQ